MFVVRMLILTFMFTMIGCNSDQNEDKTNNEKNFGFDESQLGKLTFVDGDLDYGPVPIGTTHTRLITVKNTGKLRVADFVTLFDDEEFSIVFRYSGQLAEYPGEDGTCAEGLDPGETCLLSISYLPTTSSVQDVKFELSYKDGLGVSKSAIRIKSLSGQTGSLEVTPDIVNFGDIDFFSQDSILLTFQNVGELDLSQMSYLLEQNGETLYSLDFTDPQSTCQASGQVLKQLETCNVLVRIDTNAVSVYDDYTAYIETEYLDAPTSQSTQVLRTDVRAGVYSLEGVLETSELLSFENVITGSQRVASFQIRNIGHNGAVIKTINSPADPGLNFVIDQNDCTNLSSEIFVNPGEVLIPPGTICIMNASINPDESMATAAFNYPNVNITYDNLKTGNVNTADFELDTNVIRSGYLEITTTADVPETNWSIPSTNISNDPRVGTSETFKIKHNGETPVTLGNFDLTGSASEYLNVSEACPQVLNIGEECTFTINLVPSLTVYNTISLTNIAANIRIAYTNESIDLSDDFIEREINFSASGSLVLKSDLVFEEFDSGASLTSQSVATSAVWEKVYIRNIGGLPESLFSLQISNVTNFSTVSITTVDGDGVRNCLDVVGSGDSLNPQDQCFYEMRAFSATNGNVSSTLENVFGAGSELSSPYAIDVDFVNVAQIGATNVENRDKVSFITHTAGYPGVGTNISTGDASVSRQYSSNATVDNSQITISPIATTFDLAVVDSGYGVTGSQEVVSFNLGNAGEYPLGINSVIITQIFDETNSTVLGSGAAFKTVSSCKAGANITNGGECQASFDVDYTTTSRVRVDIEVRYTLGDKSSPDDTDFIEYTSFVKLYYEGYSAASVADLNIYDSGVIATDFEIKQTVGPENTASTAVTIQNDSAITATDIHYALMVNGAIMTLTGAGNEEIAFPNFVAGVSPIEEYLRESSSTCVNASGNDILSAGNCTFGVNYFPKSLGDTEYTVLFRYFNGVTYTGETFTISTEGLTPAKLEIGEVIGAFPFYEHDFEGQVIGQSYSHEISITNTGETIAQNFTHELAGSSFRFENTSVTSPTCGTSINPGEACYLELYFDPLFADIGNPLNKNFVGSYETGEISAGANVTQNIEINAKGLPENIRSKHYGWDSIYSIGYNEAYATELGGGYDADDLGFVEFTWNSMDDVDGDADRYFIFKSENDDIDIYNDSPYAIVNRDGSQTYTYEDKSILNVPLKVWFYRVIPEKNGAISQIIPGDFPVSTLRVVIPNKHESLVHKYMMNRELCKLMDITDTTLPSFDPIANGCTYLDKNSATQTVSKNYDLAVDMYETSSLYQATNTLINAPANTPVEVNLTDAQTHCSSKDVTYSSTDPTFSLPFKKALPNKLEHSIYGSKASGEFYDASNCVYDALEPLTGDAVDCRSKFSIEQAVGGFNEWTISEVDGFGKGKTTNYDGFSDNIIQSVDYKKHFQFVGGVNSKYLLDPSSLDNTCYNVLTGIPEKEGALGCVGDNYSTFTDDPGMAGPKVIDISTEASNLRFVLWHFNSDLSSQGITVNVLAGGGESNGQATQNNSSLYNVEFTPGINPRGGARCVTRITY